MTKTKASIGARVRYSATFLRSIGVYTGDMPFAKGTITALKPLSAQTTLATIAWDANPHELPVRVNIVNLETCK